MSSLPGDPVWPHVLFDLDGTLANTIPMILASYRWTIESHGLAPADDATIRSWIGRTLIDMFTELAGPERAPALVESYRGWQHEHFDELLQPYPGVLEVVHDLAEAGVGMAVVTSRYRPSAERALRALGFDDHLHVQVGMEDTEVHKPRPEPLLLAARALTFDPGRTVYVGDATVDLVAAEAAGMAGVGVTWGAGLPAELAALPHAALADDAAGLRSVLLR
ncbi:HAD family hydrolase [Aestuariimicrobium soli]|uniref:HAD family hydrolase n=1 Tax=Aestuariimicrobium soli TaxID=2035834 RepID=UPI003EB8CD47